MRSYHPCPAAGPLAATVSTTARTEDGLFVQVYYALGTPAGAVIRGWVERGRAERWIPSGPGSRGQALHESLGAARASRGAEKR